MRHVCWNPSVTFRPQRTATESGSPGRPSPPTSSPMSEVVAQVARPMRRCPRKREEPCVRKCAADLEIPEGRFRSNVRSDLPADLPSIQHEWRQLDRPVSGGKRRTSAGRTTPAPILRRSRVGRAASPSAHRHRPAWRAACEVPRGQSWLVVRARRVGGWRFLMSIEFIYIDKARQMSLST
jgi:hypothetical protein